MTIINHEDLPDWAIEEALKPVNAVYPGLVAFSVAQVRDPQNITIVLWQSVLAHAQMIFKHQKEPVDPLLEEAREVCAKDSEQKGFSSSAKKYRAGDYDDSSTMNIVLAALRRGVEIGKDRA